MIPGKYVWIRYMTTQKDSFDGVHWRRVQVKRAGHVSETDLGRGVGSEGDGWWVVSPPCLMIYKFFLKRRILDIEPAYECHR